MCFKIICIKKLNLTYKFHKTFVTALRTNTALPITTVQSMYVCSTVVNMVWDKWQLFHHYLCILYFLY